MEHSVSWERTSTSGGMARDATISHRCTRPISPLWSHARQRAHPRNWIFWALADVAVSAGLLSACIRSTLLRPLSCKRKRAVTIDVPPRYRQQISLQETLCRPFEDQGLVCRDVHFHSRMVINRKTGARMHRRWVQAVFCMPPGPERDMIMPREPRDVHEAANSDFGTADDTSAGNREWRRWAELLAVVPLWLSPPSTSVRHLRSSGGCMQVRPSCHRDSPDLACELWHAVLCRWEAKNLLPAVGWQCPSRSSHWRSG